MKSTHMYLRNAKSIVYLLVLITPLLCSLQGYAQVEETMPGFEHDAYDMALRSILDKAKAPGAYHGKIALDFADYYNVVIKQFPDKIEEIDMITKSVADDYALSYTLEGKIMKTAGFQHPNTVSAPVPLPPAVPKDTMRSKSPVEIFKVVEQMPRFPGCEDTDGSNDERYQCAQQKLLNYVYENLQYPTEARTARVEGRVIMQFVVETNGEITDIQCVGDIGSGCGAEAVRIVASMNNMDEKWTPGKQRGKPVRVQFTLPVSFKL